MVVGAVNTRECDDRCYSWLEPVGLEYKTTWAQGDKCHIGNAGAQEGWKESIIQDIDGSYGCVVLA